MSINYEVLEGNSTYLEGLKVDQLLGWDTLKSSLIYYDQFTALKHIVSADTDNNITNSGGLKTIPMQNNGWIGISVTGSRMKITSADDLTIYNTVSTKKIIHSVNAGSHELIDTATGWTLAPLYITSLARTGFNLQGDNASTGEVLLYIRNKNALAVSNSRIILRAGLMNSAEYAAAGEIIFGRQGSYYSPTDCGNEDSYIAFSPSRSVGGSGEGVNTEAFRILAYGQLSSGAELSPDVVGGGLCLYQVSEAGNILSWKMATLAHGMTSLAETDTLFTLSRVASTGGAEIRAYGSSGSAQRELYLRAFTTTADTANSFTSSVPIVLSSAKKSGTSGVSLDDTDNLLAIANYTNNKIIVKGSGSMVFLPDTTLYMSFLGFGGMKIGNASTEKIGFWGASPVARQSHIANPTGGATTDSEARTAINSILTALETIGVLATS